MNYKKSVTLLFFFIILSLSSFGLTYTSAKHADLTIPTFTIDSDIYEMIYNGTFNLSQQYKGLMYGGTEITKDTTGNSPVYVKIDLNGVTILDKKVRTVKSYRDHGIFTIPILLEDFHIGSNNVKVYVKETGKGSVTFQGNDFHILFNQSEDGHGIEFDYEKHDVYGKSTSPENVLNFSVQNSYNSSRYNDLQLTIQDLDYDDALSYFYLTNFNGTETSVTGKRWLETTSDTGSAGLGLMLNDFIGINTLGLFVYGNYDDNISYSTTFASVEMSDIGGDIINHFNKSINVSHTYTGTSDLFFSMTTPKIQNGTQIEMKGDIFISSNSGAQQNTRTPFFIINSSDLPASDCEVILARSLQSGDTGALPFYISCDNVQIGKNYTINMYTEVYPGESLNILAVSLEGFEVSQQDITTGNIKPFVTLTDPLNNSNVSGNQYINWTVSDVNGNLDKCMIKILNEDQTLNKTLSLDANSPYSINWNDYAISSYYWVNVSCNDTLGLTDNDIVKVYNVVGNITNQQITAPAKVSTNTVFNVTNSFDCVGEDCPEIQRNVTFSSSNCKVNPESNTNKLISKVNGGTSYTETIGVSCSVSETINLNISLYYVNYNSSKTVSVTVETDGLSTDESSCLFTGYYSNGTVCAVGETNKELNMIGLIIGFFAVALFFGYFGFMGSGIGPKVLLYGISILSILNITFTMYATESGTDLTLFLRVHFWYIFFVTMAIGFIAIISLIINLVNVTNDKKPNDELSEMYRKWRG